MNGDADVSEDGGDNFNYDAGLNWSSKKSNDMFA